MEEIVEKTKIGCPRKMEVFNKEKLLSMFGDEVIQSLEVSRTKKHTEETRFGCLSWGWGRGDTFSNWWGNQCWTLRIPWSKYYSPTFASMIHLCHLKPEGNVVTKGIFKPSLMAWLAISPQEITVPHLSYLKLRSHKAVSSDSSFHKYEASNTNDVSDVSHTTSEKICWCSRFFDIWECVDFFRPRQENVWLSSSAHAQHWLRQEWMGSESFNY